MAITKTTTVDKIEVVGQYKVVQVKMLHVFSENGVEVSRNAHRYILTPNQDITNEPTEIQNICNASWTKDVKDAYLTYKTEQDIL